MKLWIIRLLFAASVAYSDLAINWSNSNQPVYLDHAGGPFVADGSLVQLIWSENGITTSQPGLYNIRGGSLLPGEYLLDSTTTGGGYGLWKRALGNDGGGLYSDTDVGGADINAGYFYTRIFNNPPGDAYHSYPFLFEPNFVDVNQAASSSYNYDPLDPLSVYSDNALGGTPAVIPAIPEPATAFLFVIGLSFTWLARKKSHVLTNSRTRAWTLH